SHITAAKGTDTTIFLEILSGPYLVQPADEAFDGGERPINVEARNLMWLSAADAEWVGDAGPQVAYLWGKVAAGETHGSFLKLPPGYAGTLSTKAPLLRVVTTQGSTEVALSGQKASQRLEPGSYFASKGEAAHSVSCVGDGDCILYVHAEGKYGVAAR
ncbi:MAG: DUF4437 domain-containing protein, partial [Deltaproteobacteria bacterium]|nr:DUF4437 domain-containing protein [Deltaproteobacteria bacterium]